MRSFLSASACLALIVAPCHGALELLTNGDFETGDFSGWSVTDRPGSTGGFYLSAPGSTAPLSGLPTAANPAGGNHYAISDTSGPGARVLMQTFTIPAVAESVTLSFQMFTNNWAGAAMVDPSGLDYTVGGNQHARVDILTASAGAFDTGAVVLGNFYLGSDIGFIPNDFTSYLFDITSIVSTPGDYQLRFSQVDTMAVFNQGVDNVSVLFTPQAVAPVPEPSAVLLGLSAVSLAALRRRRA